jgi:nuclear migration protein JNM1
VVDARDVDFSDRVGTERKSYIISSRRRRRRHRKRAASDSNGSSDGEEESLPTRLARLRRETEELRIELEQQDSDDGDDAKTTAAESAGLEDGFSQLSLTLDSLQAPSRRRANDRAQTAAKQAPNDKNQGSRALPQESNTSTITAISTFADRLTSLESVLGVSTNLPTTSSISILPTLTNLSTQIDTLSSTLSTSRSQSSLPNLDELSTRVRTLVIETDKLTLSRKAALQSLSDLHEARLRNTESTPYGHARHLSTQSQALVDQTSIQQKTESKLFLNEQSSKIGALYELLPTIQSLHPLLPTVLDRLRSLQVVHAGAAEARMNLEKIESRQGKMEEELKRWREGLDAVERGMQEHEKVGKENVEVVKSMVEGLEGRLKAASQCD